MGKPSDAVTHLIACETELDECARAFGRAESYGSRSGGGIAATRAKLKLQQAAIRYTEAVAAVRMYADANTKERLQKC